MDVKSDRQPVVDRNGLDLAITGVCCVPLVGESPKGGWSHEIQPEGLHSRNHCCPHEMWSERLRIDLHRRVLG